MPTTVSISFSQNPDPAKAMLEACVKVKNELNTPETDLVILFASPEYAVAAIEPVLSRSLKPKHLIGSSTGAIILSGGVANHGIALAGINSDEMSFGVAAAMDIDNQDMYYAGFDLARRAAHGLFEFHHRELFITFSEGLERTCSQFVRGAKESLGSGFPVLGAISSDDWKYKKISQFYQDQILHHAAVGLVVGGAANTALGSTHGFKPLGKPRTATKVEGYILRTIDDKPASDIYRHFLGHAAEDLQKAPLTSFAAVYPLGFYMKESNQYLLRMPIDILEDGSIVCHEGIPEGAEVHLMISNSDACRHSGLEAAKLVKASLGERRPNLVLIFESMARHKILGNEVHGQIQAIRDILGRTIPIIGMGTYGQIAPFGVLNNIKNVYLHNGNILIMAI